MAFQSSYGILSAAFASLAGVVSALANVKPNLNMASPILETLPETEDESKIKVDHIDGNIKIQNVSFSCRSSF